MKQIKTLTQMGVDLISNNIHWYAGADITCLPKMLIKNILDKHIDRIKQYLSQIATGNYQLSTILEKWSDHDAGDIAASFSEDCKSISNVIFKYNSCDTRAVRFWHNHIILCYILSLV